MTFYCRMDAAGSLQECYSQCTECFIYDGLVRDAMKWRKHLIEKDKEATQAAPSDIVGSM